MDSILSSLRTHAAECVAQICGDAYLCPGPHLADCIPRIEIAPNAARGRKAEGEGEGEGEDGMLAPPPPPPHHDPDSHTMDDRVLITAPPDGFGAWVPSDSEPILLIKTHHSTLVYVHSIDLCFVADPCCALHRENCPMGTVLTGHFLMENGVARVLVQDLTRLAGQPQRGAAPIERYQRIRPDWFVPGTCVVLQWAGYLGPLLHSLHTHTLVLPHPIRTVVRFTADPMTTERVPAPLPAPRPLPDPE